MCNVAGASSSSQNAKPGNSPPQKESAQQLPKPQTLLDITEEMVPTPYKKIIRQVYTKKLKDSFRSQIITAGTEQDETLQDLPKGTLIKG